MAYVLTAKLGSYKSYLLYKNVIGILRENDSTMRQIADNLHLDPSRIWHVMRTLVKHEVVKIVRYDISGSSKRGVYRLIKDE